MRTRVCFFGNGWRIHSLFLGHGLIEDSDSRLLLFSIYFVENPPEPVTAPAVLGVATGLPEESWGNLDRLHPMMTLFQWTMDPSDPMSVARDEHLPATLLIGGDYQVLNFTSHALGNAYRIPTSSA